MSSPIDTLFSTSTMSAAFSSHAHVEGMLNFEAALARAEAHLDIIPLEAANAITASCKAELFDVAALFDEARSAGTPAIPLVRMLTEHVDGEAKKFVHWGATSQDVIDTALMLQMRTGLDLLISDMFAISETCATLAGQHRHTVMVGRTLLQQAAPITFGLKAARWLSLVTRQVHALREHRMHSLAVQAGGAVGTLASLGDKGLQVVELLARELKLSMPDLPWHTERDRIAGIAGTLGVVAGAMAKIANDIVLLTQSEVGDLTITHTQGKGGSSTLPHKRNPVDATTAIASARLAIGQVPIILSAMTQEHERATGGWQAEWSAIPSLFRFTASAVEHIRDALASLQVDATRMRANLDSTGGLLMAESLTMALAPLLGRPEAYRLVQATTNTAIKVGIPLRQAALENREIVTRLSPEALDYALDPVHYLGSNDLFIDRALIAYHKINRSE